MYQSHGRLCNTWMLPGLIRLYRAWLPPAVDVETSCGGHGNEEASLILNLISARSTEPRQTSSFCAANGRAKNVKRLTRAPLQDFQHDPIIGQSDQTVGHLSVAACSLSHASTMAIRRGFQKIVLDVMAQKRKPVFTRAMTEYCRADPAIPHLFRHLLGHCGASTCTQPSWPASFGGQILRLADRVPSQVTVPHCLRLACMPPEGGIYKAKHLGFQAPAVSTPMHTSLGSQLAAR